MSRFLAFAKRPIGIVTLSIAAVFVLCCCGGSVMASLFSDDPKPASTKAPTSSPARNPAPATTAQPTMPAAVTTTTKAPATTKAATTKPPAPKPSTPKANCHPNYSVCLPITSDVNCGDISHRNFRVIGGQDPYRLDGDGNGIACEGN